MNSDFWIKKWQTGDTRFHQSQFHPLLVKYADYLKAGTILVPLCGKSLDMLFLASKGYSVIGVELSPIACKDFFTEAGIEFTSKEVDDFIVFESEGITLWCGDFFKLPETTWSQVTGLYDRAALVALPEQVRKTYASEITARSLKGLEILLITLEYPEGTFPGPPFAIFEEEITRIYKDFAVIKIHSEKEEKILEDHPRFKFVELIETIYFLKKLYK